MSLDNKIKFAGDISIDNISIVTSRGAIQNVTNQILSINIYEDLFSPFISGIAIVKESFDLTNVMPFIGEEFLNIKLYTPSLNKEDYIDEQFYIFKIANKMLAGDRTTLYELHFISREAIVDANKRVSKVYEGLVSDIAKDIYTSPNHGLESTKTINVETTINRTKFISNFWSPIKALQYLADDASTPSGSVNYVTFENRRGFNFLSLESLYNQPIYQDFVRDNYTRTVNSDNSVSMDLNKDYKRILDIDVPVLTNYLEKATSGMYASKIIANDIVTKQYISKNYDMLEDFQNTDHLNEFAPNSNKIVKHSNSVIFNIPKTYNPYNGISDISNAASIQRRTSQLAQAQNDKIEITVLGRTDYTVGMKVKVTLYKTQQIVLKEASKDVEDKILSGNYIVSAINHNINRERHECIMELIKDSYLINISEGGH